MSFDNQSVLVTGAASGIGRAIAQAFASEGAAVLLCDRDEAGLEETLTLVNAVGGRGRAYGNWCPKTRSFTVSMILTVRK